MALTERLALLVSLDADGAIKGLNNVGKAADRNLGRTESKLDRTGQKFQKAGVGMLAAAGLVATGLYKAGQSAADLEQAVGGTQAVFKDTSGVIDEFAKGAAQNFGLSERAAREATTSLGGQLKGLGFDLDDAAQKSMELTGVAADLAATYGGTTAEAVQALGAAFRGEADPAERFNLFLNQNRVNAKAVELGLAATTSQVDAHAKAQATLALITEQSADAQGQFKRELDSASGSMQVAAAEFENAKAALGESVAPILADVAQAASSAASGFTELNAKSGGAVSKVASIGVVALGAAGGLSFVTGKVIEMRGQLGTLVTKIRGAEGGLSRLGKVGVLAGVAAGAFAVGKMIEGATELKIDIDALAVSLGKLDAASVAQNERAIEGLQAFGKLDDTVRELASTNVLAAERLVEVAEAAGVTGGELENLKDIIDAKRESDVLGARDAQEYASQVDAAVGPSGELAGASDDLGGAVAGVGDQAGDAASRIEDLEKAYEGLLDATLSQFDADLKYRGSLDNTEDSLIAVNDALKEHGANSEEYRRAVLDAEGALLDQAAAAADLLIQTAEAGGAQLTAAEKTGVHKSALESVRDTLAPGSPLRAALDGYVAKLAEVPATLKTRMLVDAGGAFRTVQEFLAYINAAGFSTAVNATANLGFKNDQNLSGSRASGGPMEAFGTYRVHKDELITMGATPARVTPAHSSAGGAGPASIVVQIGERVIDEIVVDSLGRYESRNGAARVRTRVS